MGASDDYIGRTVASKYRVEQLIGEGGMGKVYRAIQLGLDKPVVLKVLRQALLSDDRTVARFQREAKAASRLNHANSITVLDFGQADDGALYIAMEFVQGKDLHHILSREWPLPESRVIRIMGQVLSALADAHSAGVIHRDLKPENIMVEQRRGEPDFVKVLDFGIAKIVDGTDNDGPALTRAGFVCGTPEYMSPEQARGAQLDHRSDLYAVGVMIYQLMTGLLPFDSDSAVGFATKHLTEVPPTPSKRRPDARISPAMERLIMRALAKNPDDRPQTAEQFRAELHAIEKERRAHAGARRVGTSAPSLSPVPRKVTPLDQQETRVSAPPSGMGAASPWDQKEDTQRSGPAFGPVPEATVTAPTTAPDRTSGGGEGMGALLFKAATVLLVALALGLGGALVWEMSKGGQEVKPERYPTPEPAEHPWDTQVEPGMRDPPAAAAMVKDGDQALAVGNFGQARDYYRKAFNMDPRADIAVRIGETYLQQDTPELDNARGWWSRARKDAPGSAAVKNYANRILPP